MSIDWITVAAQVANFLVLVWLLKRFLYRPILDGIDAREAEIAARMQEAGKAKDKAEATELAYDEKMRALHAAEAEMSETIRKSAEAQRDSLLAEAHERMAREQVNWQAHLDEQARAFTAEMHRTGASVLFALTRKALTDLGDETLENRIALHLIAQIKPMAADLQHAAGNVVEVMVTSHKALGTDTQHQLTAELKAIFPAIEVQFETDVDQSPGLVLRAGGVQVAWTVESYVEGLAAQVERQLESNHLPKATPHGQ